jgi:hypothetical protein
MCQVIFDKVTIVTCRTINKYIKKECVKLVIKQNYVKTLYGQQNIKVYIHTYLVQEDANTKMNLQNKGFKAVTD